MIFFTTIIVSQVRNFYYQLASFFWLSLGLLSLADKEVETVQWNVTPRIWDFGRPLDIVENCGSPSPFPLLFLIAFSFLGFACLQGMLTARGKAEGRQYNV